MLKCIIFIVVIILFENCNYSRVGSMGMFGSPKRPEDSRCFVEQLAEDRFIAEEYAKAKKIYDLKQEMKNNKDKLDAVKTAKSWMPPKTWKPWEHVWHFIKKCFQVAQDMKNIVVRDWILKPKLKAVLKENQFEALFNNKLSGLQICEEAFKHKFFTHLKKWVLVANHPKTIERKQLWIRVQTPHYEIEAENEALEKNKAEKRSEPEEKNTPEIERKKYWRYAKLCMAIKKESPDENDPNEPFKVYISAAEGYGKKHAMWHPNAFVFNRTPRKLRDWINNSVFWWHRVVHVEGYLW